MAITPDSEIKRILREKDAGMISGIKAMKDLLFELQRQVQTELGKASLGSWNAFYLDNMLDAIRNHITGYNAKSKNQIDGMLGNMWNSGQQLVEAPLAAAGGIGTGGFGISSSSLNVMKDFTFHKLDGLSDSTWDKIRGELTLGVLGGKTPHEVSQAIGKNLTSPSIFKSIHARANVITNTEMGRVFSKSAQERMETAAKHIEGLEKQWLHDGHSKKPRVTHVAAHGQVVTVDASFLIGSVKMMHPRDPGAPLDEVINCTCNHVPFMKKWGA